MTLIDPATDAQHMKRIADRYASHDGSDRLVQRVDRIHSRVPEDSQLRLLKQARTAKGAAQRILWLRREADLVIKAAADVAPCRQGCSSCCNIAVLVAEPEAIEIGQAIGRVPQQVNPQRSITGAELLSEDPAALDRHEQLQAEFFGQPCPFLDSAGACTIYQVRPMACRHHISLDDDDLLCRPVRGGSVSVPKVDRRVAQAVYLMVLGLDKRVADLRDWFPG
jgi:Fe-S-cluster containining protein